MPEPQRLQKVLARWGLASRRQAEALIAAGRVRVNGQLATLGDKVEIETATIELDGQVLSQTQQPAPTLRYLLLHKPAGFLSTCHDPQGRPTVLDLLPASWRRDRLYPIGRLDVGTTGALILTNDGDLTLHLTHPRFHLPKTYRVEVKGHPSPSTLDQWRAGVLLDERQTLPVQIQRLRTLKTTTMLKIVLHEGRKRQIRRVAALLGHPVVRLHREAIGSLSLGTLASGQYRLLETREIHMLK